MATFHTATRVYIFECSYNSLDWIDDPTAMISSVQSALSGISGLTYQRLRVANVRNSSKKKAEMELVGVTFLTKTQLNTTECDDLIDHINTALLTISNLSFSYIDICGDVFDDDQTTNWPGQSMQKE